MNGLYLATLFIIGLYSSSSVAQFCKWVDKDGAIQYAETCPEDVNGALIKPQIQPSQEQVDEAIARSEQLLENKRVRKEENEYLKVERESKAAKAQRTTEKDVKL